MSKRKNTLNDLEEFLKLQASTLVAPQALETPRVTQPREIETPKQSLAIENISVQSTPSFDLAEAMKNLAAHNKRDFYDHIIKAVEGMSDSSNDVLLINTALYLKHGDNWKQGIEEYWRKRKSSMA